MSNKKNTQKKLPSGAQAHDVELEANVLFQKIFNKWYAFTTQDDECFMTEVSEEDVQKRTRKTVRPA